MVLGLRRKVFWEWGSEMVFGFGEMAHQDGHPFLHTLGFDSCHPSLVPEDFRVCSKPRVLPYHPPLGSRNISVRSNIPNHLFPKHPNHLPPTNPPQTSTPRPNPHPLMRQECPNPAHLDLPNHHQKQTTDPLHTRVPPPPIAVPTSAYKKDQAPPIAHDKPDSKSPPAVSPAQTHLCARAWGVVPRLKRSHRWSGLN